MMQKPMRPNRWADWKAPQRFHFVPNIRPDEVHLRALPVSRLTGWRAHILRRDKKEPVITFFLQNKGLILLWPHSPSFGFICYYNARVTKFIQQSLTDNRFLRLIFILLTIQSSNRIFFFQQRHSFDNSCTDPLDFFSFWRRRTFMLAALNDLPAIS